MSDIERLTITLTAEMASDVRGAVEAGDYASSSEVIREALREWRDKRAARERALDEMREFIAVGLRDVAEGRVVDFDAEDIIRRGRELSAKRDASA